MNIDSPFEQWRLKYMQGMAASPEIMTLLALAFEGGRVAQPEQEPEVVAVIGNWGRVEWVDGVHPQIGDRMYSAPPSKPWVSLTDEEINDVAEESEFGYTNLARAIEAALKEKNNV